MYKQTLPLAPGETLQLDWGKNYADFSIQLNGQSVGSFPDKASLKLGRRFHLPGDGQRQITVILADHGLEVWQNGVDVLSGIKSGDSDHFANACNYLIGYGTLQLIGSVFVAVFGHLETLVIASAVLIGSVGMVLIGLGFWAKKTGTTMPLTIALVLLVFNIVLAMAIGRVPGLFITGLMIYYLYKGIRTGAAQKPQVQEFATDGPLDEGI